MQIKEKKDNLKEKKLKDIINQKLAIILRKTKQNEK